MQLHRFRKSKIPPCVVMLVTGSLALATTLVRAQRAPAPKPIAVDLRARSPAVRWPNGLHAAEADLFAHNRISVARSCAQVWPHVARAAQWPAWYANSAEVTIESGEETLGADSHFKWKTFGLPIRSSVFEFEENTRLAWFGHGSGMYAYHTWLLEPRGAAACEVITEEITNGPAAAQWRRNDPGALHRGHEGWLQALKQRVEQ